MIKLPIYFHTSETHAALDTEESLGVKIDIDDEEYDIKMVAFYQIAYVLPHPEGKGTMIGSGADEFRSPMLFDDVIAAIEKAK